MWSNSTPAAPLTITIAPGANDTLVACAITDSPSANDLNDTPSGWAQIARHAVSGYDNQVIQVLQKKASGSETSIILANGGSSAPAIGYVVSHDGRDPTTWLDVTPVSGVKDDGAATTSDISITPITNGCDLVFCHGQDVSSSVNVSFTFTTQAGTTGAWTTRADLRSGFLNVAGGTATQVTAGAVTARVTCSVTGEYAGVLIALRPAAAVAASLPPPLLGPRMPPAMLAQ